MQPINKLFYISGLKILKLNLIIEKIKRREKEIIPAI